MATKLKAVSPLWRYLVVIVIAFAADIVLGRLTVSGDNSILNSGLIALKDSTVNATKPQGQHQHKEYLEQFLQSFFSDSIFQLERISFPLKAETPINHYDMDTTPVHRNEWRFVKNENLIFINHCYGSSCQCDLDEARVDESTPFNRISYDFKLSKGRWYLVRVFESAELDYETFRGYRTK